MSSGAGNLARKIYFLPVKGKIGRYRHRYGTSAVRYSPRFIIENQAMSNTVVINYRYNKVKSYDVYGCTVELSHRTGTEMTSSNLSIVVDAEK